MITKTEALALITSTSRYHHVLRVGALMRQLAQRIGTDEDQWELVGLLHDLDHDQTRNDRRQHGIAASERLRGQLDEVSLHAIRSRDHRTGVVPTSRLDIALLVADATTVAVEGIRDKQTSVTRLKAAIKSYEEEKTWIPKLLTRCEELGIPFMELLAMTINVNE